MAQPASPPAGPADTRTLTASALFAALVGLGPFRIIHQSGASTFEAIAPIAEADVMGPFLNIICDAYHWHLRLDGCGHAQTFDQTHARSGRRVLFIALADEAPDQGGEVFARLYVHRAKGAEFDASVLAGFMALHADLAEGRALAPTDVSQES